MINNEDKPQSFTKIFGIHRKLIRFIVKTLIVSIAIILSIRIAWHYYWFFYYRGTVPETIEIKALKAQGTFPPNYDFFVFISEYCGGGVLSMSRGSSQEIQEAGLSFFENATKGRSLTPESYPNNITYPVWQETPALLDRARMLAVCRE